jgi:hypothetical protein
MTKIPQHQADYSAKSDNPKTACAVCIHFEAPHGCSEVEGIISPAGWCKLFSARKRLTIRKAKP